MNGVSLKLGYGGFRERRGGRDRSGRRKSEEEEATTVNIT